MEQCDNSFGEVGSIFEYNAKELFVDYAKLCSDKEKEKIASIVLDLSLTNDYCVRDSLLESTGKFLPKKVIRTMILKFQKLADTEKNNDNEHPHLHSIKILTRQIT